MMNLEKVFNTDKRGTINNSIFIEQVDETSAILSYYGQGDEHESIYSYSEKEGWKHVRYYDRAFEKLSDKEKTIEIAKLFEGLNQIGFTDISEENNQIVFKKPSNK